MAAARVQAWGLALLDVLWPRVCPVTGEALLASERGVSQVGLLQLPEAPPLLHPTDNEMLGKLPPEVAIQSAVAAFRFEAGGPVQDLIHGLKYLNQPAIGYAAGRHLAQRLLQEGTAPAVQAVQPVPLHRKRLRTRGYNQSAHIARGVASVLKVPVLQAVRRIRNTPSQTGLGKLERRQNIAGAFDVQGELPSSLLLVDDVFTTGATLAELASTLLEAKPALQLHLATLAFVPD